MRRRVRLMTLVLMVLATAVHAAGRAEEPVSSEESAPREVRVEVLRGPTGMGMIRLMDERPVLADGANVEYAVSGAPDNVVSKVLSGEVDIAALPSNVAAKLYNDGVPYRLAVLNTLGVVYVVSNDPEVETFDDLAGRQIENSARGANPDVIFRYLLSEHGIDPEADVELRYHNHTELAQLLIAGRAEVAVLPEPFVTRVVNASDTARVVLDLQEVWREIKGEEAFIGMGSLVVSDELVEERPDFVRSFLDEYRASVEWVNRNPDEAGVLIEENELGFTAESAAEAIPRANITYVEAAQARGPLEEYFSVLLDYDEESLGGRLPDEDFYLDF